MVHRVQFWRQDNPIFSPTVTQQMTRLISPINPLCADQVELLTLLTTLVVNLPALPPFKHKPFSAFNYAQDFETRVKESIKKYFEFEVGCPHKKWPALTHVWYFQAFFTTLGQAVLDTVHVTNFVQSHLCRWRTDSFTFVRVVSSIFFDFRHLSSDLQ